MDVDVGYIPVLREVLGHTPSNPTRKTILILELTAFFSTTRE